MKDQNWDVAMFKELSSAPAALEAAKFGDLIACLPGNSGQMADATQAYTQAYLKGTETWVELPDTLVPPEWKISSVRCAGSSEPSMVTQIPVDTGSVIARNISAAWASRT